MNGLKTDRKEQKQIAKMQTIELDKLEHSSYIPIKESLTYQKQASFVQIEVILHCSKMF